MRNQAKHMNHEKPTITNTTDLDGISLEQALIDFEVANARVIDLTARLTSLSRELLQARTELAAVKLRGSAPAPAFASSAPYRPIGAGDVAELESLRDIVHQLRASRAVRGVSLFSTKLRKVLAR